MNNSEINETRWSKRRRASCRQTSRPGPRCIKLFARLFFAIKKTPANLYANCNGNIFFLLECPDFAVKNSGKKFYAKGPWTTETNSALLEVLNVCFEVKTGLDITVFTEGNEAWLD